MNSRRDWTAILTALQIFRPTILIARSKCPGLIRLFKKHGGFVTAIEQPGGTSRLFGPPEAVAKFIARLECCA